MTSAGARTPVSWASYRESIGDRSSLFAAVAAARNIERALYAGSYVDLSPSTAIPHVTYVDTDRRAARYFADRPLVTSEVGDADVRFIAGDYTHPLAVDDHSFDLLISLYAGPVWDHCARYLRPGGFLLANTSHGDACVAALDPRLDLVAAVQHRGDRYRLDTDALDEYLVPKKPEAADADAIRQSGRGIAYTRAAFAYVFRMR
ncbi:hypothetical protein ACFQZV_06375 [Microbacterium koreense]|uniref:Class I SAM-dependent methyltransferase n=1 Tax=Microbacterium koreense TaxID=323761 RepID=A0ABW2ZR25_9MICO